MAITTKKSETGEQAKVSVNGNLYSPLPTTTPDASIIRLFELAPGSGAIGIRGRLFHTRLRYPLDHIHSDVEAELDVPSYEALSYVWGDIQHLVEICLNDAPFQITRNLHEALCQLRLPERRRILWIDALCINQADYKERNIQVALMRDIYSAASKVLVWLGSPTEHSASGMSQLQTFFKWCHPQDIRAAFTQRPFNRGLRDVLERTWWSRAWVVQEAAVATRLVLLCGTEQLPFPRSARTITNIEQATGLADTEFDEQGPPTDGKSLRNLRSLIITQKNKNRGRRRLLSYLIFTYIHRQCSDPRDRVFAFLGLTGEEEAHKNAPDYALTVTEVALRLLCSAIKDPMHDDGQLDPMDFINYGPTSSSNLKLFEQHSLAELACERLVSEGEDAQSIDESASGASPFKVEWEIKHTKAGSKTVRPTLPGILVDSVPDETTLRWPFSPRSLKGFPDENEGLLVFSTEELTQFFWPRRVYSRAPGDFKNRWDWTTSVNGRKTIVPCASQSGDKICILSGFPRPIVLRRHSDGAYDVVGECHLEGVMQGELMDERPALRPRPPQLKDSHGQSSACEAAHTAHPSLQSLLSSNKSLEVEGIVLRDYLPQPSQAALLEQYRPSWLVESSPW